MCSEFAICSEFTTRSSQSLRVVDSLQRSKTQEGSLGKQNGSVLIFILFCLLGAKQNVGLPQMGV